MLAHSRCSGSRPSSGGFPAGAGSGLGQGAPSLGFVASGLIDQRDPWCILAMALASSDRPAKCCFPTLGNPLNLVSGPRDLMPRPPWPTSTLGLDSPVALT